jgi:hypothetical protein
MKTKFNVNLMIKCVCWWTFQDSEDFFLEQITSNRQLILEARAASDMTYFAARCAITVNATSVSELWLALIVLSSSYTGFMIRTVMTRMLLTYHQIVWRSRQPRLHLRLSAPCSAGVYRTMAVQARAFLLNSSDESNAACIVFLNRYSSKVILKGQRELPELGEPTNQIRICLWSMQGGM